MSTRFSHTGDILTRFVSTGQCKGLPVDSLHVGVNTTSVYLSLSSVPVRSVLVVTQLLCHLQQSQAKGGM